LKDSYLTAGIRIRPLLHLLARNRVSITPVTLGRVLFLLQSAFWSSFFSRLEQLRYGELLKQIPQPTNPIFIIGHWRTGSTFLHQLMSRDPGLAAPTLFQVALPENFLISYRFYKPILGSLLGEYRPMDNVKIGFDEPQEDEYAIFRLTSFSPLEQLLFPRKKEYFLFTARFLPKTDDLEQYGKSLANFYKKIVFISGKKVISKNPFNSLRIPFLSALFPEAKFIHIVRHPYAIVPSTRHLWNVIQKQNVLNRNGYIPTLQEITSFLSYLISIQPLL